MKGPVPGSVYRKVINAIHENWRGGAPFAIWEVRDHAKVSTSSARRIVTDLVDLRLLNYKRPAYASKHYRVVERWPVNVKDVIQNFELAKVLGI